MIIRRMTVLILSAVLLLPAVALSASNLTIIDFESFGLEGVSGGPFTVPSGGEASTANGQGIIQNGFLFKPGPDNTSTYNDLHGYNNKTTPTSTGNLTVPWNGTTLFGSHDDLVVQRTDGGLFTLVAFDYAGYADSSGNTYEGVLSLTGTRNDGSVVNMTFTPDGVVDGLSGSPDFQSVTPNNWVNLVKVEFSVSGLPATSNLFAFDNFEVIAQSTATPVPAPSTWLLFGMGLMTMLGVLRRRNG